MPPLSVRGAAPLPRVKAVRPELQASPQDHAVKKIPTDNRHAPGRRPDVKERWYAPNAGDEPMRQRKGNPQWYLPPDAGESSSDPEQETESPPRNRQKGGTQVFDGKDYEA